MAVLHTYSGDAAETARKITEDRKNYSFNTVYFNKKLGVWWYENSRGYIHIIGVERQNHYLFAVDYLLTDRDTVVCKRNLSFKKTLKEVIEEINESYYVVENPEEAKK